MRVVITGLVVSNGGDAAILDAQLEVLRRAFPDVEVAVHDSAPEVFRRLYPDVEVHPIVAAVMVPRRRRLRGLVPMLDRRRVRVAARVWRTAPPVARRLLRSAEVDVVRSIATADVVAHTGGTTLIETYKLDPKIFELEVARDAGAALVLLPQSLGPFTQPGLVTRLRGVIGQARLVLLRDERSLQHLRQAGIATTHARVVPDIVFALADAGAPARLRSWQLPEEPAVAVSVRDCTVFLGGDQSRQRAYEDAIGDLVEHLVRARGARVTFVSTCQGTPEYWADDSAVAARIADRLPADLVGDVTVDRQRYDHAGLAAVLSAHDLAITTRMHAGIIALGAGTPVFPLAYEFKTREVMGQLGLGAHVQSVGEVSGATLVEGMDALLDALPALRAGLASELERLRVEANELDVVLTDALSPRTPS